VSLVPAFATHCCAAVAEVLGAIIGTYRELFKAAIQRFQHTAAPSTHCAVAEVLRAIIGTYRELFKAPALTEAVLFSNYALTALVVDEVCREVGASCAHVC